MTQKAEKQTLKTNLRVGDPVMVISGGNKTSRQVKGEVGKIKSFIPKKQRVVVEGVNMIKRHKRAMSNTEAGGIIEKEAGVHISNVMFYSDELKRPVRISYKTLDDGRKVRGYRNPETDKFEQIDM